MLVWKNNCLVWVAVTSLKTSVLELFFWLYSLIFFLFSFHVVCMLIVNGAAAENKYL